MYIQASYIDQYNFQMNEFKTEILKWAKVLNPTDVFTPIFTRFYRCLNPTDDLIHQMDRELTEQVPLYNTELSKRSPCSSRDWKGVLYFNLLFTSKTELLCHDACLKNVVTNMESLETSGLLPCMNQCFVCSLIDYMAV